MKEEIVQTATTQVTELLRELAQQLGVAAEYVFSNLVLLEMWRGVSTLVCHLAFWAVVVVMLRSILTKLDIEVQTEDDKAFVLALRCGIYIICVVLSVFSLAEIHSSIQSIFVPEGVVIKDLIRQLTH